MRKRFKVLVAALVIGGILAGVLGGVVFAADPQNPPQTTPAWCGGGQGFVWWDAVSKLLSLTPAEIQAQLQEGKTLVQIAVTKGVSENALVDAIIAPHREIMQERLGAGIMTQAQYNQMLQWMEQRIREAVNQTSIGTPAYGVGGCGYGQPGLGTGPGMMKQWGQQGGQGASYGGRGFGMMGGMMRGW